MTQVRFAEFDLSPESLRDLRQRLDALPRKTTTTTADDARWWNQWDEQYSDDDDK